MATVFKTFLNDDVVTARTLLHEAIPVTGSLVARTYPTPDQTDTNIKNYPHGMFQSVYDYPYMSSSANHIFDLTVGLHASSDNYDATTDSWAKKKKNVYNQMAQVLVGHDKNGDILKFDQDGDFAGSTTDKYTDALFINIARLIGKDEIRKGTFQIRLGIGETTGRFGPAGSLTPEVSTGNAFAADSPMPFEMEDVAAPEPRTMVTIQDTNAATDYRVNSPAGEYGILKISQMQWFDSVANVYSAVKKDDGTAASLLNEYELPDAADPPDALRVGLIYYQAGVIVLDPKIFLRGTQKLATGNTEVGTGMIPYTHDDSNIGNGALGNYNNPASDGHCDWLKDDLGQLTYPPDYQSGQGDVTFTSPYTPAAAKHVAYQNITDALSHSGSSIEVVCNGLRNRLWDIKFNNTTELNSTIYFCRINHNDFNYSSNPTYLGENDQAGVATGNHSKIRVKRSTLDAPVSYITTIGLYSADNELLAVAKLSEPLKKDPQNEMILRVRLDY